MSTALTGMVFNGRRGRLKRTGQISTYARGDDGARRRGLLEQFDIETVGQYALTSNIEVAHLAANGITFGGVGGDEIQDAANGLVTFLTNDVIVVKGAATPANNAVYTVTTGGVAGHMHVNPAITPEAAGPYVSFYKRAAHSNNAVRDLRTGLIWSRYTSNAEKVGEASTGLLIWADPTKVYPLHPAAADLAMVAGNILRIVGGAAELPRYHAGDLLHPSGFASADNNLPGAYVLSVAVNGADLDITLDPWGLPAFVAQAAGGARSIGLVTRSIFNYAAGANLIGLGGYTDWRPAHEGELHSLMDFEAPTCLPNAIAFPGWPAGYVWSSTSNPIVTTNAIMWVFNDSRSAQALKTGAGAVALVRP